MLYEDLTLNSSALGRIHNARVNRHSSREITILCFIQVEITSAGIPFDFKQVQTDQYIVCYKSQDATYAFFNYDA